MTTLLELEDVSVDIPLNGRLQPVLHDISLKIGKGETVGLVGESGSGKSMTARAVARLLPPGARVRGSVRFDGIEVTGLSGADLRRYRSRVAMVFQDPRAHINPYRTIGDFLTEALRINSGIKRSAAEARAVRVLDDVGVGEAHRRMRQHPHELSGGLLQRVMIASTLLSEPDLLLADEPTTALDVTTQSEVMAILDELSRELGLALLFITHDLELAAAVCDRTVVMYAGHLMETQASDRLHDHALHPYTAALTASRPSMTTTTHRLVTVPGRPLSAFEVEGGCAFSARCSFVTEMCRSTRPLPRLLDEAIVACHRAEDIQDGAMAHE